MSRVGKINKVGSSESYWEVLKNWRVRGFSRLVIPDNTTIPGITGYYRVLPSITGYYQVFGIFVSVPAPYNPDGESGECGCML